MYDFKRAPELAWVAGVAAGVFLLQVAAEFDPATITDWRTWAVALGAGAVRAAAAGLLALVRR